MAFTYIIYSLELDRYYIGSTRGLIEDRLFKHNHQHKGFTSAASDWKLVYQEEHDDYSQASAREKTIKKWKSRTLILRLINSA